MHCVFRGENLPGTLSLSNMRVPEGHYGTICRSDRGTFCDIRIGKCQKMTSCAADRSNTESPPGRTFYTDSNNTRKTGKIDDIIPLTQTSEGECEKV